MSTTIQNALPASLRKPVEASRTIVGLMAHTGKPILVAGGKVHTAASGKDRLLALPPEPDDARLTGVTRSLNRRLLGLNVCGSLVENKRNSRPRVA